jgi:hypothetical protein
MKAVSDVADDEELATYSEDGRKWFEMNWLFAECYM